jgi:hypothetical protein
MFVHKLKILKILKSLIRLPYRYTPKFCVIVETPLGAKTAKTPP